MGFLLTLYALDKAVLCTSHTGSLRSALESLINFAYSGKVKIDGSNVQSLLVGASFLQLAKVREACADFLKHRLVCVLLAVL